MSDDQIQKSREYVGSNLPVTRDDLSALSDQRLMLLEFVAKQLRKDTDYGVIPGTPKSSLFKPGAEKLARLFGLGVKLNLIDKTIDQKANFAMFTYKAEIIHLNSGQSIAECEASCNSQEKKYKERTTWVWSDKTRKKEPIKEATPMYDVMNTLQKMAQKRAYVGGIILAVAASDFFTQDIDDVQDAHTIGISSEVRDVSGGVPKVTKVTSEPSIVHDAQPTAAYLAEALTSYDERDMVKSAGFRWDKDAKKWLKEITAQEAASLPFQTQRVS
jgi:hypothetical protein